MRQTLWLLVLLPLLAPLAPADDGADPGRRPRLSAGRATLIPFDREREAVRDALSFQTGLVGRGAKPDLRLIHGNRFSVYVYKDDRSVIVDLGAQRLEDIRSLPTLPIPAPWLTSVIPVLEGHVYLIHAEDEATDHVALLRVESHVPDEATTVAWVALGSPAPNEGKDPPTLEDPTTERLLEMLRRAQADDLRTRIDARLLPEEGPYHLQLRTGAQGNTVSEARLDRHGVGIDRWSRTPLPADAPTRPEDEATAYATGGRIPPGYALVIEAVTIEASSAGDAKGPGAVLVRIGPWEIHRETGRTVRGRTRRQGRIVLLRHGAQNVAVQAASTSRVDVTVEGRLVPTAEGKALKATPLRPEGETPAPDELVGPTVEGTIEVRKEGAAREQTLQALGRIPQGMVLEVRLVHYEGRAPFEIRLGERTIAKETEAGLRIRGAAAGRWTVHADEEPSFVVRADPGAQVRVALEGRLEAALARPLLSPLGTGRRK